MIACYRRSTFQCVGQNQSYIFLGGTSSILRTFMAGPVQKHPVGNRKVECWAFCLDLSPVDECAEVGQVERDVYHFAWVVLQVLGLDKKYFLLSKICLTITHQTKMELCDSVQLDPEKDNSWQGVHQEDADGLTFLF